MIQYRDIETSSDALHISESKGTMQSFLKRSLNANNVIALSRHASVRILHYSNVWPDHRYMYLHS
jgi:outer membrane lipopolysaccharide assembly protein LptE/RlpB